MLGKILSQVPLDRIPLHVPAGCTLSLAPAREYAAETPDAPLELRIYPGTDGSFTLYQDQGDGYQYEKGAHATIGMHWDDASRTLRLDARDGHFDGMPGQITFQIVLVGSGTGTGSEASRPLKVVTYMGQSMQVSLR